MTVRIGLIGYGAFVRLYHLPALLADSRVELAIVCDPALSAESRKALEESAVAWTHTVGDVWRPGACDAVIISTPHALHAEQARQALIRERHVLVDKPFVLRSADARELTALAETRGVVAGVAFNRRFDRSCLRACELLCSGELGVIRHVETIQFGYPSAGWIADPALAGGGPFVGRGAHTWRIWCRGCSIGVLDACEAGCVRAAGAGVDGGGTLRSSSRALSGR